MKREVGKKVEKAWCVAASERDVRGETRDVRFPRAG